VTFDRTSGISLAVSGLLHTGLAVWLGFVTLNLTTPAEVPMLIEVTLSGTSAPRSQTEGVKADGEVIAPRAEEAETAPTAEQLRAWQEQRRREISQELAKDRTGTNIGESAKRLRQDSDGLAAGRGAGESGQPGSPKGILSLSGEIATRGGYREPDFSILKGMITEETQLRLLLVVLPEGEVKKASLLETSGYPFVDQKAIELARKIVFDPLPLEWKQVEQQGVLTIKLKL
jgi:TonB family protein